MDNFLFSEPGETEACLSQLASVIECDESGHISILHASLSDFLLDPSRSHQLYLCRESVLGDCVALGLRHMRQPVLFYDSVLFYLINSFLIADLQHVVFQIGGITALLLHTALMLAHSAPLNFNRN